MFTLFYTFLLIYTCSLFLHAEKSDKRWNFNVFAYTFTLYRVVYSVHFLFKSHKPNNSKGHGSVTHALPRLSRQIRPIRRNEIWIMSRF